MLRLILNLVNLHFLHQQEVEMFDTPRLPKMLITFKVMPENAPRVLLSSLSLHDSTSLSQALNRFDCGCEELDFTTTACINLERTTTTKNYLKCHNFQSKDVVCFANHFGDEGKLKFKIGFHSRDNYIPFYFKKKCIYPPVNLRPESKSLHQEHMDQSDLWRRIIISWPP